MFNFIHNPLLNIGCFIAAFVASYAAVKRFNYKHQYIEDKTRLYYWQRFVVAIICFTLVYIFVGAVALSLL